MCRLATPFAIDSRDLRQQHLPKSGPTSASTHELAVTNGEGQAWAAQRLHVVVAIVVVRAGHRLVKITDEAE
jgi:hypothetical protein